MSTIILNGSPKGNSKSCNSQIISEEFVKKMKNPCELKAIAGANPKELAKYVAGFNSVIIVLPLYIHAMPGIVMKFIEELEPTPTEGKSMGFIVQAGFIETAQHKYLESYFANLAKELNYNYLGTVSKGEAAGIYMYPKMFKKVLKLVSDLGKEYEATETFDKDIVDKLRKPYELSKFQLLLLRFISKVGLANIGWHRMLKKNNALERRLDRPFL